MFSLNLRMSVLVIILFSIIYMIVSIFMHLMGITGFVFYVVIALVVMGIQYMLGPKIVEMMMRIQYIKREDDRELFDMVEDLSRRAKIPLPKIGIAQSSMPNAFAFGRSLKDSRVCVTRGIMNLLEKDEIEAVLAHEISHLKNRDVLFITLLSVIPLIMYRIAFHFLFFGRFSRRGRDNNNSTLAVGLAALVFYFITNLIVLYGSRVREYFAERGAVKLGVNPSALASALYKLVYGSAKTPKESLKQIEGIKAFFLNDPSRARREISDLAQIDINRSGTIDPFELEALKRKEINLNFSDRLMELLSTHPNMLKRIKHISSYK